jgi:hypothetical protein
VIWRAFRKTANDTAREAWWLEADAAASAGDADRVASLAQGVDQAATEDEAEDRREMVDGLRALATLRVAAVLPTVATQHRVIGADACHFLAPAALVGEPGAGGKLFLTTARVIFVGGRNVAWPWHRVRRVTRLGRELLVTAAGAADALHVHCNTYEDALVAAHIIARLAPRDPAQS